MRKLLLLLGVVGLFVLTGCAAVGEQAEDPGYFLGNEDASVVISQYTDYQCPACGSFHAGPFQLIKAQYIDTGLVKYESNDYPLPFHNFARPAHQASYCAGEQDPEKYWEMGDTLYRNNTDLTRRSLTRYAEELELDVDAFDTCVDERRYKDVIEANMADGLGIGVRGTPSVYIDGVHINHSDFNEVKGILDQALGLSSE